LDPIVWFHPVLLIHHRLLLGVHLAWLAVSALLRPDAIVLAWHQLLLL
jgi:hypothetical protein